MKVNRILLGDVLEKLATVPDGSVDVVVTSPPYFQLRDYGMPGQIGLEDTPGQWVDRLVAVGDQLARVLTERGTWWLNLGDSYSRGGRVGIPAKSLVLAPERLLLALADAGWIVRNKVVWAKTNPVPSSVTDRLNCTWEPVYLLTRSPRYHFDLDAIRQPHRSTPHRPKHRRSMQASRKRRDWIGPLSGDQHGLEKLKARGLQGHRLGKNPGDVWQIATARCPGARIAVLPLPLIERVLHAACPAFVCSRCGEPWSGSHVAERRRISARQVCACDAPGRRGIVLDPFIGTGSTAIAAGRLQRSWLGIELNRDTAIFAHARIDAALAGEAR